MHKTCKKTFLSRTFIFIFCLPTGVFADATDSTNAPHHAESSIDIEYFNMSDSNSKAGNSQVSTSGALIQTEYETNNMVISFNYERWKYNWKDFQGVPFVTGTARVPWSTFTTLQLGLAYEQELEGDWEFNYYVEAESSFEKEMRNSNEYEAGIDFIYEPSDAWHYTLNLNLEYLDASGGELGVDFEIEWNHDKKDGWSGEFEISSEFPESSMTYHFTKAHSNTLFYSEGGTNTIRLSNSSPVAGMQGGYFEDGYKSLGLRYDYEFSRESYVSFIFQRNTGRSFSFVDSSGRDDREMGYQFSDTTEAKIAFSYTF